MRKYELTNETKMIKNLTLHRVRFLIDIPLYNIKAGDVGGWIEGEKNLSQNGDCAVLDDHAVIFFISSTPGKKR